MTNKLTVPSELIHRAIDAIEQVGYQDKFIDYTFVRAVKQELRAALADPVPPAGYAPCSPELLESGVDCATAPRWSSPTWDGHSHWHPVPPAGGQVEVYSKPADYWEGYKGHACYKDTHDLKKMVQHLESVLDDVPDGELVDRAHVTRLQAELTSAIADKNAFAQNAVDLQAEVERLQSELTKAREALREIICACGDERSHGYISMLAEDALSNQSAPADKGRGDQIVFGCSRCGGTQAEWSAKCIHCHPVEQPAPVAVVLADDWQDQLFAEMERRFSLSEQYHQDHMVNDDTQIGVEFATEWITARLDEFTRLNSEPKP